MSFNVFEIVQKDREAQADIDARWPEHVNQHVAQTIGKGILAGMTIEAAQEEGDKVRLELEAAKPSAYKIDGTILYPSMVSHIRKVLAGEEELPSAGVALYRSRAKTLMEQDADAFEMALTPRAAWEDGHEDLVPRSEALEICRLWFTRLLKEKVGYLYLHITDQDGQKNFRL